MTNVYKNEKYTKSIKKGSLLSLNKNKIFMKKGKLKKSTHFLLLLFKYTFSTWLFFKI